MKLDMALFVVVYTGIMILTYYVIKTLFMVSLDYSDREDRELLDDTKAISVACALVSAIWIFYIPYILLRMVFGKTELE